MALDAKSDAAIGLLVDLIALALGTIALAAVTWVDFRLGLSLLVTAVTYFGVLLLCCWGSFHALCFICLIAAGSLNYFFIPPIFSFRISHTQDIIAVVAFLITSLIVARLLTLGHLR